MAAADPQPPALPEPLLEQNVTAKLVWVWLLPLGWVELSHSSVSEALGVSQNAITRALNRLRELGLLEYQTPPEERRKATFRAVRPD